MARIRSKFSKKFKWILLASISVLVCAAILLTAYFLSETDHFTPPTINKDLLNNAPLSENLSLYSDSDTDKVWQIYITSFTGADPKTGKVYNIESMNKIVGFEAEPVLESSVYIVDPKNGSVVTGSKQSDSNSTTELRGQSARRASQKSYQVKLYEGAGTFKGQSTLNLNKHTSDKSKISQKMCFDLIKNFPHMVSLRTSFFRVYIKDGTKSGSGYTDYGLFTHTEQPNKTFLNAHGLDPNASLYKPSDFEFFEDKAIVSEEDESFDIDQFSQILKIRENPDNAKLAKMLEAINDQSLDFNEVFDRYFDRENYLTWCAMNFLFNNYDTMSRNFLLYSPASSEKWYFLPWDYDASLINYDTFLNMSIQTYFGISRYWGTVLHKRFFSDPENVKLLDKKMDELYKIIMDSNIDQLSQRYFNVVNAVYYNGPDYNAKKISPEDMKKLIFENKSNITKYYHLYYSRKELPMPIFLGTPKMDQNGKLSFNWSSSYDFQADRLYYTFSIYTDLTNPVKSRKLFDETSITLYKPKDKLPDGLYYWEVTVVDGKGNTQKAFDRIRVGDMGLRSTYFGVAMFRIKDGKLYAGSAANATNFDDLKDGA